MHPRIMWENLPQEELNRAAQFVRQAAIFHANLKDPRKQVRGVDSWKKVAGAVLGSRRLPASVWQAVLSEGVRADLFTINTTDYRYPVLEPTIKAGIELPLVGTVYERYDALLCVDRHEGRTVVFRSLTGTETNVGSRQLARFLKQYLLQEEDFDFMYQFRARRNRRSMKKKLLRLR
jgi:hypothetical protein